MYESTHPVVEIESTEVARLAKKLEKDDENVYKLYSNQSNPVLNILENSLIQNENEEELIFEKKKSKKKVEKKFLTENSRSCNLIPFLKIFFTTNLKISFR